MSDWPKVIDGQHNGDPFVKLIECDGKRYVLNEAALIEQEEATYRSFEMDMRLRAADALRSHGIPWF
jgi:hypothetical protein